jgi:HD-like signal output (HDOD) protein/AmiR/NasT family two-component response regulator
MQEKIPIGQNPLSLKYYTVMLADDSNVERALVKRFLLSESFDIVHESADGEDLMYYLETANTKPDIICVDLNMPKKNGLQVIKEVKEKYPQIKTIVISSLSDKPIIQALTQLKVNSYIMKPYNRMQVIEKFAMLVGKSLSEKPKTVETSIISLAEINIPPMPQVAMQIMSFDSSNPAGGSEELEKIIGPDKSITADIMKISNSAFYGRAGSVKTLKDAITLLGMKTVKNLVILQSRKKYTMTLTGEFYEKFIIEFPILNSLIAFDLASTLNLKKIRDEVFLSSLLKKIGMTIIALNFNDSYSEILENSQKDERSLLEHEMNKYSMNHIQVGIRVFKLWNLPQSMQNIIANQNFRADDISSLTDIDRISRLGEFLAIRMMGFKLKQEETVIENALYKHYKMTEEMKLAFADNYYEMIKDHPFFEKVA